MWGGVNKHLSEEIGGVGQVGGLHPDLGEEFGALKSAALRDGDEDVFRVGLIGPDGRCLPVVADPGLHVGTLKELGLYVAEGDGAVGGANAGAEQESVNVVVRAGVIRDLYIANREGDLPARVPIDVEL